MAGVMPSGVSPASVALAGAGRGEQQRRRPTAAGRRVRALAALPLAALLAASSSFTGFVASRRSVAAQRAAASPSSLAPSRVTRGASKGREASDDVDMIQKLRQWKKSQGSRGFGATPAPAPAKPAEQAPEETGEPAAAQAAEPSPAPAPAREEEVAPPPPVPESRPLTARDAIGELLKKGQEYGSPTELNQQQLIMVFFNFFAGWRQRAGVPGDVRLTEMQKQMVILLLAGNLNTITSANEFWPRVCAELNDDRDPEMKELRFALTGFN